MRPKGTRHALRMIGFLLRQEGRALGKNRSREESWEAYQRSVAYHRAAVLIVAAEHAPDRGFLEKRAAMLITEAHQKKP